MHGKQRENRHPPTLSKSLLSFVDYVPSAIAVITFLSASKKNGAFSGGTGNTSATDIVYNAKQQGKNIQRDGSAHSPYLWILASTQS